MRFFQCFSDLVLYSSEARTGRRFFSGEKTVQAGMNIGTIRIHFDSTFQTLKLSKLKQNGVCTLINEILDKEADKEGCCLAPALLL